MTTILLTTVFGPYSAQNSKYNKDGDEEWLDYLYSRLTKEPGLFAMSSYPSGTSLQLIAANLEADVTVLLHPTYEGYVAELKKGYHFVGITFLIKGLGKLFPMIAAARKYSPASKVVIGGFGTMLHNLNNTGADYVCKGEGVSFFENLLGGRQLQAVSTGDAPHLEIRVPPARRQPLVTADVTLKCFRNYAYLPRFRFAQLTHGFGCPHKCEFCTTSAYYGYRHIPFGTGRQLYDAMSDVHGRTGIGYFFLFEEDMCLYKASVNEWGELIRQDQERAFSWACFSTVKSLSSWDLEELVSMGFSHVWIGIESITSPFTKSCGRPMQGLFDDLHSLGVTTTGSIIFGLDHHTPDNLAAEVDNLVSLWPTSTQIGTLMPADGTALRDRLEREGRVRKASYKESDLYSEILIHPNFKEGQLRDAVFAAYDDFYSRNGPAIHRSARTWLNGARRLRASASKVLQRRAQILAARARVTRPVFLGTQSYLPNDAVRDTVRETVAMMEEYFGAPTSEEEAQGRLVEKVFALEQAKADVIPPTPIEPEPSIRRWVSGIEVC